MKIPSGITLLLLACLISGGCAHNLRAARWTNLHAGDPDLAGIRVQQFPDCQDEQARYEGRHPAMILYVFKDDRVHQTCFEPDGKVSENFWFTVKPDDPLWETMDSPR